MDRPRSGTESVLCSVLLLGRSAMSANRVSRSRSGLNDGAADPSLSTCMRVDQPDQCTCTAETCRCAPLSFNYARRTPFFPLLHSSPSFLLPGSTLRFPTFRDFRPIVGRIQRRERERKRTLFLFLKTNACSSFSFFLQFDQVTRVRIDSSPRRRTNGRAENRRGNEQQSGGWV